MRMLLKDGKFAGYEPRKNVIKETYDHKNEERFIFKSEKGLT
jgi:hypothetical protein